MYNSTQNTSNSTTTFDVDSNGNLFSLVETTTDTYTPVDILGLQPQITNLQMNIAGYQASVDKNNQAIADANAQIASLQATQQSVITAVPSLADKLNAIALPAQQATPPSPADLAQPAQ